jgi:hypothetical protein
MLWYQHLLNGAEQLGLEKNEQLARDWLGSELHTLFREGLLDDPPTRAWSKREWRDWLKNLGALQKLSEARPPQKYDPAALARASAVLKGVCVVPAGGSQEVQEGQGTQLVLTTRSGKATTYPADFDSFWQAMFLSLFRPNSVPQRAVCHRCGKPLPPSKIRKKPSRAKLCPSCRVTKFRQENPDEARAQWREQKRRERSELKQPAWRAAR